MFRNLSRFNLKLTQTTKNKFTIPNYSSSNQIDQIKNSLTNSTPQPLIPETSQPQKAETPLTQNKNADNLNVCNNKTEPSTPIAINKNFISECKETITQILCNITPNKNEALFNFINELNHLLLGKNGFGIYMTNKESNKQQMCNGYLLACFGFIILYLIEKEKILNNSFFVNNSFITSESIKMINVTKKVLEHVLTYTINKPSFSSNSTVIVIFNKQLTDVFLNVLSLTFKQTNTSLFNELMHDVQFIANITINDVVNFYSFIKKGNSQNAQTNQEMLLSKPNQILIPFPPSKQYTLVLDLDETLVHVSPLTSYFNFRPGLKAFLNDVSQLYELILFTTSRQQYANNVLSFVEKEKKFFSYKLYRQHSTKKGALYIKDLSLLGRDLSKIIIVDDSTMSFTYHKDNAILIKPFTYQEDGKGDKNDYVLYDLSRILCRIAKEKPGDIRESLRKYKSEIEGKISF